MAVCRVLFCLLSAWLLLALPALGGAPELTEDCDAAGVRIPTQFDSSRRSFAEAAPIRRSSSPRPARFVIYINPERTFLGRETQQWLYYRQCAHIVERHAVIEHGERALQIRDEEQADCWAAQRMLRGKKSPPPAILYAIERDLDRVLRDGRWNAVLPGPQRRIALSSCKP
jgi:hypothetical protein